MNATGTKSEKSEKGSGVFLGHAFGSRKSEVGPVDGRKQEVGSQPCRIEHPRSAPGSSPFLIFCLIPQIPSIILRSIKMRCPVMLLHRAGLPCLTLLS
jgi:hypothetical protein